MESEGDSASRPTNSGQFQKGHPKYGGRRKGVPNKFGADVRSWLLAAAEELGADGKGKGGGKGFVKSVGLSKAEALLAALVKQLPAAKDDRPVKSAGGTVEVRILAVPRGCQVDASGRLIWPDGSEATPEQTALEMFQPTPWPNEAEPAPVAAAEPEPVVVEDDKVAVLNAHRRRRDDDETPAA